MTTEVPPAHGGAPARHAFFSKSWFDMAVEQFQAALRERPRQKLVPLVLVERFEGAPAALELDAPYSIPGLRLDICGHSAQVQRGLLGDEQGQVVIVTNWDDAVRAAQMLDGPALAAFSAWRVAAGRHRQEGTWDPVMAQLLRDVHDRIALHTSAPPTAAFINSQETT